MAVRTLWRSRLGRAQPPAPVIERPLPLVGQLLSLVGPELALIGRALPVSYGLLLSGHATDHLAGRRDIGHRPPPG